MEEETRVDKWRKECWANALHCFGYSHVYKRRLRRKQTLLRGIHFVGLGIPLIAGAAALTLGLTPPFVLILEVLGVIQIVIYLGAIVFRLEEAVGIAQSAANDFQSHSADFKELGNTPPEDEKEFKLRLDKLAAAHAVSARINTEQHITPKEERRAHRAGLREFQRKCLGCRIQPMDMKSTTCPVCGQF